MIVDIDLISLLLIFSFVQGMKLRRFYFFIVVEFSFAVWYHHEFPGLTCALEMNMYYKFVIPSCLLCPWNSKCHAGEMTRWWRALVALPEDLLCCSEWDAPRGLWHLNTWSPAGGCLGRMRKCGLAGGSISLDQSGSEVSKVSCHSQEPFLDSWSRFRHLSCCSGSLVPAPSSQYTILDSDPTEPWAPN